MTQGKTLDNVLDGRQLIPAASVSIMCNVSGRRANHANSFVTDAC